MKKQIYTDNNQIDIEQFGIYLSGLTNEKIDQYIKERSGHTNKRILKLLRGRFNKIAGINTMGVIETPCCKKSIVLMYRHDVKRFADQLFEGKRTYWD